MNLLPFYMQVPIQNILSVVTLSRWPIVLCLRWEQSPVLIDRRLIHLRSSAMVPTMTAASITPRSASFHHVQWTHWPPHGTVSKAHTDLSSSSDPSPAKCSVASHSSRWKAVSTRKSIGTAMPAWNSSKRTWKHNTGARWSGCGERWRKGSKSCPSIWRAAVGEWEAVFSFGGFLLSYSLPQLLLSCPPMGVACSAIHGSSSRPSVGVARSPVYGSLSMWWLDTYAVHLSF
jgi:hypothetical protein